MASSETKTHNSTVLAKLQKGDLVEFNRGLYSHWGVYIGNEEIVHLSGVENDGINGQFDLTLVCSIRGERFDKAKVVKENFWKVTGKSKAMKNNGKDRKYTPLAQSKIVKTALSKVGETGYNVLWHNCEHFAAFCRYGKKLSGQVDRVVTSIAVFFIVFLAVFVYRSTRPKKDKEKPQES